MVEKVLILVVLKVGTLIALINSVKKNKQNINFYTTQGDFQMNILLCCSAGMSTSLLVTKWKRLQKLEV